MTTPAEPENGSTITAAMLLASCRAMTSSSRSASARPSVSGMPRQNEPTGGCVCGRWSASPPWPPVLRLPGMPPTEMPPKFTPW